MSTINAAQNALVSRNLKSMYTAKTTEVAKSQEASVQSFNNNEASTDSVQISAEAQQLYAARASNRELGTLKIGSNLITWTTSKGKVHLDNDRDLRNAISDKLDNAEVIARQIRRDYREERGTALDISTDSLTWEIIGHIYPGEIAKSLKKVDFIFPSDIRNGLDEIIKKTETIDMGEEGKDENRWLWDKMGNLPNWVQGKLKQSIAQLVN